jgi:GT2 family glycosyltransferase
MLPTTSTDDSIAFISANFLRTNCENDSNFGFARGYNEALKYIDAEIYALVNSDIEVTENWLLPITQTFEKSPTLRSSTQNTRFKINSILNMPDRRWLH